MAEPNPHARATDPDTSQIAGVLADKRQGALRVLQAMAEIGGERGHTASEIDRHLGFSRAFCHRRLSDCHIHYGWAVMTAERRKGLFNNRTQAIIRVTPEGWKMIDEQSV